MPPSFSVPLLRAPLTGSCFWCRRDAGGPCIRPCRVQTDQRVQRRNTLVQFVKMCSDDAAVPIQGMDPKFLRNQKHAKKSQGGAEGKKPVHNKQRVSTHPVPPLFSARAPSVLHFPGRICAVVRAATHSFRKSKMGKSGREPRDVVSELGWCWMAICRGGPAGCCGGFWSLHMFRWSFRAG